MSKTTQIINKHGKRYTKHNNYNLNFDWDLLGIDHIHQKKIDPGLDSHKTRLWLPIPISIYIATVMKNYVCLMSDKNPGAYGSEEWMASLDKVGEDARILDPTAGAGGSTIGLSMTFKQVFAGDFCERQLAALRNNLNVVEEGSNVTVDKNPVNVLTRRDISTYDAMILSPFWGGAGYKQHSSGSVDLYLKNVFRPQDFEIPSSLKTGTNANEFIVNTMKENPRLKFITLQIPINFNASNLLHNYLHQNSLEGVFISPHKVCPCKLTPGILHPFEGNNHRLLTAENVKHFEHFGKYDGPDRFILVFRKNELETKLDRLKSSHRRCTTCNKAIFFDDTMQLSGGFHKSDKDACINEEFETDREKYDEWEEQFEDLEEYTEMERRDETRNYRASGRGN
jgi:hypothetical protein